MTPWRLEGSQGLTYVYDHQEGPVLLAGYKTEARSRPVEEGEDAVSFKKISRKNRTLSTTCRFVLTEKISELLN